MRRTWSGGTAASLLAVLLVLVAPTVSLAGDYAYYTRGFASNSSGGRLTSYVSGARAYIYPKPVLSGSDGRYYLVQGRTASGSYLEAGYKWHALFSSPYCFTAWWDEDSGTYTVSTISASLSTGAWVPFVIEYDEDTPAQRVYVDGVQKGTWTGTGITSMWAVVDSERSSTTPANLGSWTYASYRPTLDGGYLYWPYARYSERSDPSYFFHDEHLGDSNHWVYVAP